MTTSNFVFVSLIFFVIYYDRREEFQRRRNPRYLAKTRRLHDLHIVMPICIPYGKIIVDDPLGANFYQFSDKPKNAGAEILFGKGISNSVPKMEQQQQQHQESFENIDQENGNLNIEKKIPKKESAGEKQ